MDLTKLPRTIELCKTGNKVEAVIIDQRRLPLQLDFIRIRTWQAMRDAIEDMAVRGAPALGVAGAAALAIYMGNEVSDDTPGLLAELEKVADSVACARPTAVNLPRATYGMFDYAKDLFLAGETSEAIGTALFSRVKEMEAEDEEANRAIGAHGSRLVQPGSCLLTHCNAGSLATVSYGTALGVVYAAASESKVTRVYIDETRPVGQGGRLTAWELSRVGIPATLICDSMAASLMAEGSVDAVFVGADRVCRNGDTANKIGTYGLAVLARFHQVPFYVCAPWSTLDLSLAHGGEVAIEQRPRSEVTPYELPGIEVYNPAFDVTPAHLIDAIVTERGIFDPGGLARA